MKEIIWSGASPVLMPREDPGSKIVFFVLLLIVMLILFIALITFMAAVLRKPTERSRAMIAVAPFKMLFAGVAAYAVFAGVAAWLYSLAFIERLLETEIVPGFLAAAIAVTAVPLLLSLYGAPGTFGYVGDRLADLHGGDVSGLRRIALGTLLSVLAAFFPFTGWFVVLPALLAISAAAGFATIFRRDRQRG